MNIKDWIKKNLDKDQINEVVLHGCVNGTVNELIYYSDTSAFHDAHEDEIWDMVWESAESQSLIGRKSEFNYFRIPRYIKRRTCWIYVSTKEPFGLVRC